MGVKSNFCCCMFDTSHCWELGFFQVESSSCLSAICSRAKGYSKTKDWRRNELPFSISQQEEKETSHRYVRLQKSNSKWLVLCSISWPCSGRWNCLQKFELVREDVRNTCKIYIFFWFECTVLWGSYVCFIIKTPIKGSELGSHYFVISYSKVKLLV